MFTIGVAMHHFSVPDLIFYDCAKPSSHTLSLSDPVPLKILQVETHSQENISRVCLSQLSLSIHHLSSMTYIYLDLCPHPSLFEHCTLKVVVQVCCEPV